MAAAVGGVALVGLVVALVLLTRSGEQPAGAERSASATSAPQAQARPMPGPEVTEAGEETSEASDEEHADEAVVPGWDGTEAGPDDAALDAAVDAVWEFASQPQGESAEQRATRLTPLFAPDSSAPTLAPPQVAPEGVELVQSVPAAIAWTSPFDTGDPARIGMLVALQSSSTGTFDGGLWNDNTTNVWRVVLTASSGVWAPSVVFPDGQPEPGGQA